MCCRGVSRSNNVVSCVTRVGYRGNCSGSHPGPSDRDATHLLLQGYLSFQCQVKGAAECAVVVD